MDKQLDSKTTAIITGVSSGIGLALAKLLLQNNIAVAGWGRNAPDIKDPNFLFCPADVRNYQQVELAFKKTKDHFGPITFLINNAGLGFFAKIDELENEQLEAMLDTNIKGVFNVTKTVVPLLKSQKFGTIINISSVVGLMGIPEASAYCATKFAVRGLSESLFKELRPYGIKVCCVYPGSTNTNFFINQENNAANSDMMSAEDVASSILHLLQSPENLLPSELVLRPMRVKL